MKQGILISNLGTPKDPSPKEVGVYLKEFLMDPELFPLPNLIQWFLVNLLIVPKRKYESAKNYEKIWTDRGSPLMFHTEDLLKKLKTYFPNTSIDFCMRYGQPAIASKVDEMISSGVEEILFVPLYPQYAVVTSASSIDTFKKALKKHPHIKYKTLDYFYHETAYIDALVSSYQKNLEGKQFDHYLFSFHGLPKAMIENGSGKGHCLQTKDCCYIDCEKSKKCYLSHCKRTAKAIAEKLNMQEKDYTITFQSRLGRAEWVKPYTEETAIQLAQDGKKKVAVFSPSFVADCIETLEELQIGLEKTFKEQGGEELFVLPCLNSDTKWAEALSSIIKKCQ